MIPSEVIINQRLEAEVRIITSVFFISFIFSFIFSEELRVFAFVSERESEVLIAMWKKEMAIFPELNPRSKRKLLCVSVL
ncbi:hypothetical protein [Persicobacter diffluens]|uniref:Uncharacterized protein n=1 Tax=Persicobacter diffluens TaxID=981 RepID=A0AAN5ALV6_9BACT|nr:hypothetical protein PEDI_23480 [Persicobacter diffluens]